MSKRLTSSQRVSTCSAQYFWMSFSGGTTAAGQPYVTGLPVDLVRAIATFFFLWLIAEPMLEKLDRIKTKYGLAE